jgi:predicted transposase YdaD
VGQGDRERKIEFIETVLLYKFPQMSREEVEAMFTLGDLKKTRVYRDALQEGQRLSEQRGEQRGKLEGEKIGAQRGQVLGLKQGLKQFAVKLLTRKFGKVTLKMVKQLDKLSAEQLEELAEAVLDFEKVADLEEWLKSKK